jgi:hypothetical protein
MLRKRIRMGLAIVLVAAALLDSAAAFAYRGGYRGHYGYRNHARIFIAPPPFWYYPRPHYYYPPLAAVPSSPPVYIEQGAAQPETPPPAAVSDWFYCSEAQAYYPYVAACPGGWQRVAPQPPPS